MIPTKIFIDKSNSLDLERFKEMDYYAVEHFDLPIELMMENAGLQLAKLIALSAESKQSKILIGIGNGNNGGGGLVAARRLAAWGYPVYLDLSTDINKELPKTQLKRALNFGAQAQTITAPEIWVDAYLGFSQRLPLSQKFLEIVAAANQCDCLRISLDIPTGFLGDTKLPHFKADKILTLAALKTILYAKSDTTKLYVADLGIPKQVYEKFEIEAPPFQTNGILQVVI